MSSKHQEKIIDQFSKQAIPFMQVPGHMDSMELLVEMAQVQAGDTVLDVACGPGIVACEFAKHCSHVTGVDITPEMIKQAEKLQLENGLANMKWDTGEACPLPYEKESFSLVITRYSFHHFISPKEALAEMMRVCKKGGRVLVADVAVPDECSEAYDRLEIMRDPSHTHALSETEFFELFENSGLKECRRSSYGVPIELEAQLKASFPKEGDEKKIRSLVTTDVGINSLGINAYRDENQIKYTVPTAVYTGMKA